MIKSIKEVAPSALAKFQLFDAEEDRGKPYYDWVKAHELNFDQAKMLFDYGQEIGIEVFFSVFGVEYVDWCEEIGVKRYKVACDTLFNPLRDAIRITGKPTIVSSQGDTFHYDDKDKIYWLYCIPEYPTPIEHIKMPYFNNPTYNKWQGFSDHTIGLDASMIALARGAKNIEKHFTLEHNSLFPDDKWSMVPEELMELNRWENICRKVL